MQSEEDRKLKDTLDLLVLRITEKGEGKDFEGVQRAALEALRKEIRSSTASMTSVPKPLKFLRKHYKPLCTYYTTMTAGDNKVCLLCVCCSLTLIFMCRNFWRTCCLCCR